MQEPRARPAKIRWKWLLPALSVAVTAALLAYVPYEDSAYFSANPGTRGYASTFAPAWTLAVLVNGPAFVFGGAAVRHMFGAAFDTTGRLIAVALFWAFVGWRIDQKSDGVSSSFLPQRMVAQLSLLSFSVILLLMCIVVSVDKLSFHFAHFDDSFRLFGFRSPVFLVLAMAMWASVATVYFGKNVIAWVGMRANAHR